MGPLATQTALSNVAKLVGPRDRHRRHPRGCCHDHVPEELELAFDALAVRRRRAGLVALPGTIVEMANGGLADRAQRSRAQAAHCIASPDAHAIPEAGYRWPAVAGEPTHG